MEAEDSSRGPARHTDQSVAVEVGKGLGETQNPGPCHLNMEGWDPALSWCLEEGIWKLGSAELWLPKGFRVLVSGTCECVKFCGRGEGC